MSHPPWADFSVLDMYISTAGTASVPPKTVGVVNISPRERERERERELSGDVWFGIGHPLGLSSKSSLDNRPWGRVIYAVEYGSRALPTTEMVHFGQTLYELKGLSWAKELPSILGIQLFFYYIIRDI